MQALRYKLVLFLSFLFLVDGSRCPILGDGTTWYHHKLATGYGSVRGSRRYTACSAVFYYRRDLVLLFQPELLQEHTVAS